MSMGNKTSFGGWAVVALFTALAIVFAGAVVALCRRHLIGWQWGRRNIWSICEEWRQRLSWLWAPREEKVGLVKAQQPTAQTVPGLYRQTGNASQNLLHSDSDLRLDAQGAFTRFEAVDRDLHPPLGGSTANAIPPQPLRPAPQPRPTARPRPSALDAPSTSEYLMRMQEVGPGPLTPPPMPRLPGPTRSSEGSVFLFQTGQILPGKCYSSPHNIPSSGDQSNLRFDSCMTRSIPDNMQQMMSCYSMANQSDVRVSGFEPLNSFESFESIETIESTERNSGTLNDQERMDYNSVNRSSRDGRVYRQYEYESEDPNDRRYTISSDDELLERSDSVHFSKNGTKRPAKQEVRSSGTWPINLNRNNHQQHHARQHVRNESRGNQASFNIHNTGNSTAQTIMESIYGPQAAINHKRNYANNLEMAMRKSETRTIETTPYFTNSGIFQGNELPPGYGILSENSTKAQGLQRVSQYIQSLPDLPVLYDGYDDTRQKLENEDSEEVVNGFPKQDVFDRLSDRASNNKDDRDNINPRRQVPPPPPAPPDPPNSSDSSRKKNTPTTGEKIFSALRSVTSQSYIDASEFYNSVLSSAQQQIPRHFVFPASTINPREEQQSTEISGEERSKTQLAPADVTSLFSDNSMDNSRRGSDLYSPELNLEAHRTAQEVYNSLQDPPASPLLLRDLSQEPYPYTYMSDPSFTRTSEDIFNSIEQRRKSMERLNGLHDSYVEMEVPDSTRRRSSQELHAALEEVELKRRLSQSVEESYGGYASGFPSELGETANSPINRRSSIHGQTQEPEPSLDESNLKRAVSCESVCSDTSVNLGDLEDVTVVGYVCVGLEHERWGGRGADCEGDLAVSVLEARDLVAPDGCPARDTLARVCLLPDRQTHVQTRLYRGSPSPSYQEKFLFPLDGGPIGRTLLVEIISVEMSLGGGASLLGEASLKLGPAARPPATTWLPLISTSIPVPQLGELMFSLSYLPTAERLTLVVVKARNLRGVNAPVPGDFFVKVYLLQQGKKMHKKKTSAKRGEESPIFNEAIIFSVPAHALQTIQLRLTVSENSTDSATNSKAYSVGHVIVGSSATGKSLAHWRQMLAVLRRPVVMWHPLRK